MHPVGQTAPPPPLQVFCLVARGGVEGAPGCAGRAGLGPVGAVEGWILGEKRHRPLGPSTDPERIDPRLICRHTANFRDDVLIACSASSDVRSLGPPHGRARRETIPLTGDCAARHEHVCGQDTVIGRAVESHSHLIEWRGVSPHRQLGSPRGPGCPWLWSSPRVGLRCSRLGQPGLPLGRGMSAGLRTRSNSADRHKLFARCCKSWSSLFVHAVRWAPACLSALIPASRLWSCRQAVGGSMQ